MSRPRALILCDHSVLLPQVVSICGELALSGVSFACSPATHPALSALVSPGILADCDVRREADELIQRWDLIVSVHCKQIFPAELTRAVRCVNFHPGFNPYNRGWLPHVFSIMNGLPAGITIHEIDAKIDHGPVIYQERLDIHGHETSAQVYARLIQREIELLRAYLPRLIAHDYAAVALAQDGNYNSKADFEKLKEIDLDSTWRARDFLAYLRAMTFPGSRNAYYVDAETGRRCYLSLLIERDEPG